MDAYPPVPEPVTALMSALGDAQRQRILQAFLEARSWELAASAIADRCAPLSRPAVSHHLGLMRRAGILRARRDGTRIYYAIDRAYIEDTVKAFLAFLAFLDVCCVSEACAAPDLAEVRA